MMAAILVEPPVLTEEESALGFEVSDDEWNARYRPWLGRTDLAAQTEHTGAGEAAGGDAGQPAADHVDPAADTAGEGAA